MTTKFTASSKPGILLQLLRTQVDALIMNAQLKHENLDIMKTTIVAEGINTMLRHRDLFLRYLPKEEFDPLYKSLKQTFESFSGYADERAGFTYHRSIRDAKEAKDIIHSFL